MKTNTLGFLYQNVVKPVLFKFPADSVHDHFLRVGKNLGESRISRNLVSGLLSYQNDFLRQTVAGIDFKNPIGLAAGFDYNADLVNILPAVGFGFHTVGTVTNLPYEGNPRPMLGRLPKSKSLLVNKGFRNEGVDEILKRLPPEKRETPYGVSIGSTNKPYNNFEEIIEDIVLAFKKAEQFGGSNYYELNISCPNLSNIQDFSQRVDSEDGLGALLEALNKLNIKKPVFIKMPVEKEVGQIEALIEKAKNYPWIRGFIFANLVKNRNNPYLDKGEVEKAGKGNFSGRPTFELSNSLIRHVYKKYGDRFLIIGCGGVFTPEDAYAKIKLGASLVELITGMVYMGPSQISFINKGLIKLAKKDGFKSIGEAVGVDAL